MFTSKPTVASLTKKGLIWIDQMEVAAADEEQSSIALETEAKAIAAEAKEVAASAAKGRKIVANFRNLLEVE